jgi:hypothetical protein
VAALDDRDLHRCVRGGVGVISVVFAALFAAGTAVLGFGVGLVAGVRYSDEHPLLPPGDANRFRTSRKRRQ